MIRSIEDVKTIYESLDKLRDDTIFIVMDSKHDEYQDETSERYVIRNKDNLNLDINKKYLFIATKPNSKIRGLVRLFAYDDISKVSLSNVEVADSSEPIIDSVLQIIKIAGSMSDEEWDSYYGKLVYLCSRETMKNARPEDFYVVVNYNSKGRIIKFKHTTPKPKGHVSIGTYKGVEVIVPCNKENIVSVPTKIDLLLGDEIILTNRDSSISYGAGIRILDIQGRVRVEYINMIPEVMSNPPTEFSEPGVFKGSLGNWPDDTFIKVTALEDSTLKVVIEVE